MTILDRCQYNGFAAFADELIIEQGEQQSKALLRAVKLFKLDCMTARKYCHLFITDEFSLLKYKN